MNNYNDSILNIINLDLVAELCSIYKLDLKANHGLSHWIRVAYNGLKIAETENVDLAVIVHFSFFHDVKRETEEWDVHHGKHSADLIASEFKDKLPLNKKQINQLIDACAHHTTSKHIKDKTIGACWDADRLDLGRVDINCDAEFLNTKTAKEIIEWSDSNRIKKKCHDLGSYFNKRIFKP